MKILVAKFLHHSIRPSIIAPNADSRKADNSNAYNFNADK
jgi:hypothetical protein